MATLVLTTVGAALGGPIGGAIGAVLGQQVDRAVFAPKGREGPRLDELRLQTSSYGSDIPKLFGTMRVAGTVIWATDLIESRSKSQAGKGQPSVTSYSYSASFAVLLSARAIRGVGRIWAEGKLLRGAAGDWKATTGFRLHLGGEEQAVDPIIASAVGPNAAPAHRGSAYAVFENLQLADYGNRIPSLTFEVIADDAPVDIGAIVGALFPQVTGEAGPVLGGFAAAGSSMRGVLEALGRIGGGWYAVLGDDVHWRSGAGDAALLIDAGVVAGDDPRRSRSMAAEATVPRTLTVAHYDAARDYQLGLQRARRPGAGTRDERVELPAVIQAGDAKAMAEAMLLRAEAERTRRVVALGLEGLAIGPGQRVRVDGEATSWRVTSAAIEGLVTRLALVPISNASALVPSADPGEIVTAIDEPVGTTLLQAAELPALDDVVLGAPRLTVTAAGTGAGWRRAALLHSLDGGASWVPAGATAAPAVMGRVVEGPGPGTALLVDEVNSLVVDLAHRGMTLTDADEGQLDTGANLALAGDELLQFGRAEPVGGTTWRLSRLWRGRRGTERAIGQGQAGDRFVLIEADATTTIDLPLAALGSEVMVMASGVGDVNGPVVARVRVTGASVRPPPPVRLTLARGTDGAVTLGWGRRSRAGWRWIDGVDAPLAEEAERYRVTLTRDDGSTRDLDATAPWIPLDSGELAGSLAVSVRQRGTLSESEPAETILGEV